MLGGRKAQKRKDKRMLEKKETETNKYLDTFSKLHLTKNKWNTKIASQIWFECQSWEETLAGPLFAFCKNGNCDYVYTRNDDYFHDVDTPDNLRDKLNSWLSEIEKIVNKFEPKNEEEKADKELMKAKIEGNSLLINILFENECKRKNCT